MKAITGRRLPTRMRPVRLRSVRVARTEPGRCWSCSPSRPPGRLPEEATPELTPRRCASSHSERPCGPARPPPIVARMARGGEQAEPRARRLAEAARAARARAAPVEPRAPARRRAGAMDVFGGEIRRRDLFPLLVLHLISREPAYGNRLIEEIEAITDGVISANPNTIYPLLARSGGAGPDRGAVGAPGPANPPLLLDHRRGAQGVPAAGRRAGALPRLGDRVGDPDQARDLRERARRGGRR